MKKISPPRYMSDTVVARLDRSVAQLEHAISRLQDLFQDRRCDCSVANAELRHENARLLAVLRQAPPARPHMLPQRRLKLAAAQQWTCVDCKRMLTDAFHVDHRRPWSESFDDSDQNLGVCCVSCHLLKTSTETSCRKRLGKAGGE